jgi:preprotein translocase subunit SecF
MELLNGTENRIRGLDKNVWGYCINMFSGLSQFFKSNTDINMEKYKAECEKAFNSLKMNMEFDDLNDIKLKIINFKTNYDNFIMVYQNTNNTNNKNKSSLYDEVKKLKDSFDLLEEEFISKEFLKNNLFLYCI